MTARTVDRAPARPAVAIETDVRPVMLLTLNVPFSAESVAFAIDAAAFAGAELWVCDAMPIAATYVAHAARQWAEQVNRRHVSAAAAEARSRGVRVTQVVFHNPKPIAAALAVCREERIGLLVFGADRACLGRFGFRRASRRLRRDAPCLVWTPE
jgi:hypothetical protein